MSSFQHPHHFYLFEMKNGKQKLAYGTTPKDALRILSLRLTAGEMAQIISDQYKTISPREIGRHVARLG